jgi:hypothetical protein
MTEPDLQICPVCQKAFEQHHYYKKRGVPVCTPNGYCHGVFDEREESEDLRVQLKKANRDAETYRHSLRETRELVRQALHVSLDHNKCYHSNVTIERGTDINWCDDCGAELHPPGSYSDDDEEE